jgi:hypothetical protein
VRKRTIYAHSDILIRRSEYFATMLSSNSTFSEAANHTTAGGDIRKIYTVIVEEADFVTIYWLLKWVYANWLMFSEEDDPRAAVEGLGAGWSAKWLSTTGVSEWEWKTFSKSQPLHIEDARDDVRSAASGDSTRDSAELRASEQAQEPRSIRQRTTPVKQPQSPIHAAPRPGGPANARRVSGPAPLNTSGHVAPGHSKSVPILGAPVHYPLSPRTHRVPTADPHPHPTPAPTPASALSVYQVAHRYGMPGLAALALEHMMSVITPSSSFALLLASAVFDEIHMLVEVGTPLTVLRTRTHLCGLGLYHRQVGGGL